MVIQTNIAAMNAQREYKINTGKRAKTTEKLSSGYKINRAADDAAGLAISEKMRRQIKGLSRATENTEDGISLCQVADGALAEVHDILNRLTELSVQAANGTLTDEDRNAIQQEIGALKEEIDRIGRDTSFNEKKIFRDVRGYGDAYYENLPHLVSSPSTETGHLSEGFRGSNGVYYPAASMDLSVVNADNVSLLYDKSFSFVCPYGCSEVFDITLTSDPAGTSSVSNSGNKHYYSIGVNGISSGDELADAIINGVKSHPVYSSAELATGGYQVSHASALAKSDGKLYVYSYGTGFASEAAAANAYRNYTGSQASVNFDQLVDVTFPPYEKTLWIQTGVEAGHGMYLTIEKMNSEQLGIGDVYVDDQDAAGHSIELIKRAMQDISERRADIGAQQNRLEHTVNSNNNTVENTQAAESSLRDADMAKEMMNLTLQNVLAQSGESMISNANRSRQDILSLLQ